MSSLVNLLVVGGGAGGGWPAAGAAVPDRSCPRPTKSRSVSRSLSALPATAAQRARITGLTAATRRSARSRPWAAAAAVQGVDIPTTASRALVAAVVAAVVAAIRRAALEPTATQAAAVRAAPGLFLGWRRRQRFGRCRRNEHQRR